MDPKPPDDGGSSSKRPSRSTQSAVPDLVSHPVGTDPRTGGQALGDRVQCGVGAGNDAVQTLQFEPVNNLFATALCADEAAVPKTCEMRANPRLWLSGGRHQLAHRPLPMFERLQDAEPGRVAQDAKKARRRASAGWGCNPRIHIWKTGYHISLIYQ